MDRLIRISIIPKTTSRIIAPHASVAQVPPSRHPLLAFCNPNETSVIAAPPEEQPAKS